MNKQYLLAEKIIQKCSEKNLTISCAESCTGGLICAALTDVPGSSAVVLGGVVSYAISAKENILNVDKRIIENYGVVSCETATEMAKGSQKLFMSSISVATTGIAGPGGEEPGKPVGTVCFALQNGKSSKTLITCKGANREEVRKEAVLTALDLIYQSL